MLRWVDEAVTIRLRDLGETDSIVDLLTREHGRISAVAKAARKSRRRFGGRLQQFVCMAISITERPSGRLAQLQDVRVKEVFYGLAGDLEQMTAAQVLLELVALLSVPGAEGARSFDWLLAGWRTLQSTSLHRAELYAAMLSFLHMQGMLAPFDRCAQCSVAPRRACFDAQAGGLLCQDCRPHGVRLPAALVEALARVSAPAEPEEWPGLVGREFGSELRQMAVATLQAQLGVRLRTVDVWEQLASS